MPPVRGHRQRQLLRRQQPDHPQRVAGGHRAAAPAQERQPGGEPLRVQVDPAPAQPDQRHLDPGQVGQLVLGEHPPAERQPPPVVDDATPGWRSRRAAPARSGRGVRTSRASPRLCGSPPPGRHQDPVAGLLEHRRPGSGTGARPRCPAAARPAGRRAARPRRSGNSRAARPSPASRRSCGWWVQRRSGALRSRQTSAAGTSTLGSSSGCSRNSSSQASPAAVSAAIPVASGSSSLELVQVAEPEADPHRRAAGGVGVPGVELLDQAVDAAAGVASNSGSPVSAASHGVAGQGHAGLGQAGPDQAVDQRGQGGVQGVGGRAGRRRRRGGRARPGRPRHPAQQVGVPGRRPAPVSTGRQRARGRGPSGQHGGQHPAAADQVGGERAHLGQIAQRRRDPAVELVGQVGGRRTARSPRAPARRAAAAARAAAARPSCGDGIGPAPVDGRTGWRPAGRRRPAAATPRPRTDARRTGPEAADRPPDRQAGRRRPAAPASRCTRAGGPDGGPAAGRRAGRSSVSAHRASAPSRAMNPCSTRTAAGPGGRHSSGPGDVGRPDPGAARPAVARRSGRAGRPARPSPSCAARSMLGRDVAEHQLGPPEHGERRRRRPRPSSGRGTGHRAGRAPTARRRRAARRPPGWSTSNSQVADGASDRHPVDHLGLALHPTCTLPSRSASASRAGAAARQVAALDPNVHVQNSRPPLRQFPAPGPRPAAGPAGWIGPRTMLEVRRRSGPARRRSGHPLGQPPQRDDRLHPGQRRADAVVDAAGEGQVVGGLHAVDVERSGSGYASGSRLAAPSRVTTNSPLRTVRPSSSTVLPRAAGGPLHRRVPAQGLLDRRLGQPAGSAHRSAHWPGGRAAR